jgi:hypothetical protein
VESPVITPTEAPPVRAPGDAHLADAGEPRLAEPERTMAAIRRLPGAAEEVTK